jgi:uncharacterized protein YjbI with pentapeptide repeats
MKKNKHLYLCACLLLCGAAASAESPGSSDKAIRKNFNRLVTTKQCPGCNLRGAVLIRMDLQGADLHGADLSGAKLNLTDLSKADLKNAKLRGASLGGADLAGADLRGADLTDAQLAGAYLKETLLDRKIVPEKPYEPEELPEALPEEIKSETPEESSDREQVERVDFPEASTQGTPLPPAQELITPEPKSDAVISDVEKEEVLPPSAEISADTSAGVEENIEENSAAVFNPPEPSVPSELPEQPAKTVQAFEKKKNAVTLPEIERRTATTVRPKELVPLAEVQIETQTVHPGQSGNPPDTLPETTQAEKKSAGLHDIPVIDSAPEQKKGEVTTEKTEPGLWETFTSLFGSDTADKEKTGKQAGKAADKSGAKQQVGTYTVETFEQRRAGLQTLIKKLHKEKRCVACDLAGAQLADQDLEEVDLERADLSGAQLEKANLRAANLKGTNFTDANLKNADLRKADLYLADFTHADLTGAQLQGALLDSTNFSGAIGIKVEAARK